MAKNFQNLIDKLPKKVQENIERRANEMIQEMRLQELRAARELSQEQIAEALETKQANISRLERREDMHISTLQNYIAAMRGELELIAHFPEGSIHLTQFD